MDTRNKILSGLDAAESTGVIFVTGYFDPMLASHARRLQDLASGGRKIVVLLADPPAPLLESRARAELVAGISCVAAVIMPLETGEAVPPPTASACEDERQADLERREWLLQRVAERHRRDLP